VFGSPVPTQIEWSAGLAVLVRAGGNGFAGAAGGGLSPPERSSGRPRVFRAVGAVSVAVRPGRQV